MNVSKAATQNQGRSWNAKIMQLLEPVPKATKKTQPFNKHIIPGLSHKKQTKFEPVFTSRSFSSGITIVKSRWHAPLTFNTQFILQAAGTTTGHQQ
jgi:hypothetical protein